MTRETHPDGDGGTQLRQLMDDADESGQLARLMYDMVLSDLSERASDSDCPTAAAMAIILAALRCQLDARDPSGAILNDTYQRAARVARISPVAIEVVLRHAMMTITSPPELSSAMQFQHELEAEHAAGTSPRASLAAAGTDVDCSLMEQLLSLKIDDTGEISRTSLPARPLSRVIMSH